MMTPKLDLFRRKKLSKVKLKICRISRVRWTCSKWRTSIWKIGWWRPMIWCSKWANLLTFHEIRTFKESYLNSMKEIKRWMRQWCKRRLWKVVRVIPRSQISIVKVNRIISSQMRRYRPRVEESNRMSEFATLNERSPNNRCNRNSIWTCSRTRNNWLL